MKDFIFHLNDLMSVKVTSDKSTMINLKREKKSGVNVPSPKLLFAYSDVNTNFQCMKQAV